ncbi:hypothetical protein KC19_VG002700 [Ceratodon purpureus]|uniref:Uncharacterized protein n=1 Tax=Ceratodon purpureus TaxID=3225 RepID=A0A8T0HKK1_CERPU|nr:hypothetical protein KC19_VG002700 [Ceratodon purpureus]
MVQNLPAVQRSRLGRSTWQNGRTSVMLGGNIGLLHGRCGSAQRCISRGAGLLRPGDIASSDARAC